VRTQGAAAGVQISASHNPKEYNGLKLFGRDGRVLPKAAGEKVLDAYHGAKTRWVGVDELGEFERIDDPHTVHAELVLKTVNVARIRQRNFKVLLDSNHGAGGLLGHILLERLGCDFQIAGKTPDGLFEHPPEPIAENLKGVSQSVVDGGYDLCFCQDPDADRLAIIDEQGTYIGEEMTLALCLLQVLPTQTGKVVTNCATSSLSKWIAEKYGSSLLQSAVGEANVADMMLAQNAIFGGEGNGGPIDPCVGYVRDSFVGMARVLDLLANTGQALSQIVGTLPALSIVKDKITFPSSGLPKLFAALVDEISDASPSYQDGLKLQWLDRWLLVRGSNTEPIVRLIAEAPTIADAQTLCDRARSIAGRLEL
jgi:phosphomannomutase